MVSIGKLNCDARIFQRPFAPDENPWGAYGLEDIFYIIENLVDQPLK